MKKLQAPLVFPPRTTLHVVQTPDGALRILAVRLSGPREPAPLPLLVRLGLYLRGRWRRVLDSTARSGKL